MLQQIPFESRVILKIVQCPFKTWLNKLKIINFFNIPNRGGSIIDETYKLVIL